MRDLNDQATGGTMTAAEFNDVPSEMQNPIEAFGQTLSASDLNQQGKSMAGYAAASQWYSETGVADVYVATTVSLRQGITGDTVHFDGATVRFRPGNANTGASTLTVNGLTARAIVREDLSALEAGDLVTSRDAVLRFRFAGPHWILQTFSIPGAIEVSRGYIDGYQTQQDADTDHDIEFGIGICRDSTDVETMQRSAVLTKQIDVAWAAGDNNGGFPTAILTAVAADTWYHLFIIKDTTSGTVDAGFDTSLTAANLLSETGGVYTLFRRVGAVKTDGSANIIDYRQHGDDFYFNPPLMDENVLDPGTAENTFALDFAPLGVRTEVDVSITGSRDNSAALTFYLVAGGDGLGLAVPTSVLHDFKTGPTSEEGTCAKHLLTNTASEIRTRQSDRDASAQLLIMVHGWRDPRGRDA